MSDHLPPSDWREGLTMDGCTVKGRHVTVESIEDGEPVLVCVNCGVTVPA